MIPVYWILLSVLLYSFLGYGLLLLALSAFRKDRPVISPRTPLAITLLIPAHNEADAIGRKLDEALALDIAPHRLDIVVVSDGSTDGTVREVRKRDDPMIRLIELPEHRGKVQAMNLALSRIGGDVVVFSDGDCTIRVDALRQLLRHFGDPAVGGVAGRVVVVSARRGWLSVAERLYVGYDNALKRAENRLGGAVSTTGQLYAVRRELISALPPAVADDLITSLRVVAQGKRLVYEPNAVAEHPVSEKTFGEFFRRVRSTERGWRGLMMMARLFNPFQFGIYSLQLASHKLLRRLSAFLLPVFFAVNVALIPEGGLYALTGVLQIGFYGLALAAWCIPALRRLPGMSVPLFFVMGHTAMAVGITRFLLGHRSERWTPVRQS